MILMTQLNDLYDFMLKKRKLGLRFVLQEGILQVLHPEKKI